MKKLIFILVLIGINFSCKKDKLEGDKAIFIGKWEWQYTSHRYNTCEGFSIYEDLTPESENVTFQLEFQEKGIFILRRDNQMISTFKTKFEDFLSLEKEYSDWYFFDIHFNNNNKLRAFRGSVNADSLITDGFEDFELTYEGPEGCGGYTSYFIKQP